MNKISATIVADSVNQQGDRLTSLLITFPRILLSEINTHRMLSKNTSSSRAIPFHKMVKAVQENPFIPIAWQKEHTGMQGYEYLVDEEDIEYAIGTWLHQKDRAIEDAKILNSGANVTKQLCNRLLEPFMWTTMLITGSKEGWGNFFNLRCPSYEIKPIRDNSILYKSRKDAILRHPGTVNYMKQDWLNVNKGQAEIHMMDLAEKIYDAMNESTPRQLKAGEWHVPFEDRIDLIDWLDEVNDDGHLDGDLDEQDRLFEIDKVKISTAMAAHTSYTIVGGEAVKSYEKWIKLHDKLISQNPPHSSPLEHCARAMNNSEYESFYKGQVGLGGESGWCGPYKGFISYRHLLETEGLKF